jgi:hypothetical protein
MQYMLVKSGSFEHKKANTAYVFIGSRSVQDKWRLFPVLTMWRLLHLAAGTGNLIDKYIY